MDLGELITAAIEGRLLEVFTIGGGIIRKYDPAREVAEVELGTRRPMPVEDSDVILHEAPPIIPEVRMLFPSFGDVWIKAEPAPGTPCLVLVSTFNDSNFLATGKQSDAGDARPHNLTSAYGLCGFSFDGATKGPIPAGTLVANAAHVKLGSVLATRKVALATPGPNPATEPGVDTYLAALRTAVNTLGGGLPPFVSVGAAKVEAE